MKISNQEEWDKWIAANGNSMNDYSGCVMFFAEHWANAMENGIEHGRPLADIADDCSHEINGAMGQYGVTGFQYGCAVQVLSLCWEYGAQLKLWHNAKYGQQTEADVGVVNPAIMVIG